jgi:hypothetical protein
MAAGGLTPPTPSSVEPIGIPPRPLGDVDPIPVGDEAEAAGPPAGPVAMPAQVPEAVPATPPPSKSEPDAGFETPVVDPPLKLPALELMPEHVALLLVGGLTDDMPEGPELTPMDPSPAVPSGIPVPEIAAGGTGLMPSGVVPASGDGVLAPIWAYAEPYRKSAAIAPIKIRITMNRLRKSLALTETAMICSRGQADRLAKGRAE